LPTTSKEKSNIAMYYQNMRCLSNKILHLNSQINIQIYDILFFIEHWLYDKELALININKFCLDCCFCRTNHRHGGSAIFIKEKVNFKVCDDINALSEEINFETCAIELINSKTTYCCIYRSPSGVADVFFEKLESLLEILVISGNKSVIIGDVNINTNVSSNIAHVLNDILLSYNYNNMVNEPTRVHGNSATVIDRDAKKPGFFQSGFKIKV
jgi:exonuclease III